MLVSLGPNVGDNNVFPLPNVTGMNVDEAKKVLSEVGLFAKNIEYIDTISTQRGVVMSTKPRDGTQVARGSQVTLIVSSGKAPQKQPSQEVVRVPGAAISQDVVASPPKPAAKEPAKPDGEGTQHEEVKPRNRNLSLQMFPDKKADEQQAETKQAKVRYPFLLYRDLWS